VGEGKSGRLKKGNGPRLGSRAESEFVEGDLGGILT
jgi:hypothetical protein